MPTIPYKLKDGTRISGSTTIIANLGWNKSVLMWWANQEGLQGRNHRDTSQKAADAGTIGHYLIECDIQNKKPDLSQYSKDLIDKAETCYLNFLQWKESVKFELMQSEVSIVHEQLQYGSTIDCIGMCNGKLSLIDWKTGSGVYEDHKIQLASYKHNWEFNYPDQLLEGGIYCIRINKETAGYDMKWRQDYPESWKVFQHLLEIHNLKKLVSRE